MNANDPNQRDGHKHPVPNPTQQAWTFSWPWGLRYNQIPVGLLFLVCIFILWLITRC